jgi:hypothetical protein
MWVKNVPEDPRKVCENVAKDPLNDGGKWPEDPLKVAQKDP